ncbi:pre-mRNA-splicing factor ISY1 homolog [Trichogramma pretiosum]|uniref:pre-mRNA-splicing factor ISY1 homolog n=1 Tax=Trichogramma pretiosum TaxID=7493 RepID=UPI0006C9C89F|nr:pre-mRNA-splicing factor ISY1 homolog [Trichogramma pretiosum]
MARNAEKAMTTLARWRAAHCNEGHRKEQERRPYLASECKDLRKCEKWRMQIIREISKKVAQIQNAGLGEFRIRDLNDEINKLLREKRHWEMQIKDLGGTDYARHGIMLDNEGREVPGNRGYKYFGAAKDLPGVRELFEQEPPLPPRKTRAELMKDIDADYYGYRDDDDGLIEPFEDLEEIKHRKTRIEEWETKHENDPETEAEKEEEKDQNVEMHIPTQQEVQAALLQRKKQELLDKYVL